MDFLQSLLAPRLQNVETSAIRELFKVLGKPGLISFAGGFPDSALFDVEGLKAAADSALATDAARALQYGATEGFEPLREAIVALMKVRGATVANTDILVTTGSQQGLDLLGKVLIGEGDTVLTEAPTFLAAIQAFKLYGAKVAGVPTDADGLDIDALEKTLANGRPKFLYVIPNFGNPSGALMSLERRKRLLDVAVRHNLLIVEDDPYGELYFDAPPPPSLYALSQQTDGAQGRVVYLGSLSKVVAPGLRVGWMIAAQPVRDAAAGTDRGGLPRHLCATARARRGVHAGTGRALWQRGRRLSRPRRQRLEDDPGRWRYKVSARTGIRQFHRWVSMAFTLTVIANFVAMIWGPPPAWITYAPLLPLALLLITGLYMFALPYLDRRNARRAGHAGREAPVARV